MYADGPKWGNGNPQCGTDRSPHIIQTKFPGCCRVRAWGGSDPLPPFPFESMWGSGSNLDITALKWACFQVTVTLVSSPCHYSHHPVYDFGPNQNQDLVRIGCGQYDQQ